MTRGVHTFSREVLLWSEATSKARICNSCLRSLRRRHASTATATAASNEHHPTATNQHNTSAITSTEPYPAYDIKAGVVLSRPPLITRDLTPFEKAFFLYQRRLNERLALPFTRYFYYQKDTPADVDWKKKIKQRITPARDIGIYNAYSKDGWNDELLMGAKESDPEEQVRALLKDAIVDEEEVEGGSSNEIKKQKEEIEKPLPRTTDADRAGDVRSLNRSLSRTLYMIVKGSHGAWEFPAGGLLGKESLHRAAERLLVQTGGVNMNTWLVGNAPVGHYVHKFSNSIINSETKREQLGEKIFFMKARIMAGQPNLADNELGLTDHKWLAKEEIQREVHPGYWRAVKNMLVEL